MTAIAGLRHGGRVYIGGDSAGSNGWTLSVRKDAKVFASGPYVLGFTTSYRMGQILRWSFDPPAPPSRPRDLERFMCSTWINAVREALGAGGWLKKESEREAGGVFLVGVSGRLFRIDDDYQVGESAGTYDAVGSGEMVALGALAATANLDMVPSRRIRVALAAAELHTASVRGPFKVVVTP